MLFSVRKTRRKSQCWVILALMGWAGVASAQPACFVDGYGLALLTDHATSYVHGEDHPLGLVLQYSGIGLWGRRYGITGPTTVNYALIPHRGRWDRAGISGESAAWSEPLLAVLANPNGRPTVELSIPKFGVRTVKFDNPSR